jgi:uncharacterized protein YfiM (DUF2279 family)
MADTDYMGWDKVSHFSVCFVIAAIVARLMEIIAPKACAIIAGIVMAVLAGLVKEMYDNGVSGDHFCKWDFIADIAGAIGGVAILL